MASTTTTTTTTTTFDFGAFTHPQSQRSAAAQRMRSFLLIPRGPPFRPRTTTAPTATLAASTTQRTQRPFAFPVIEDDDSASDSEGSVSDWESDSGSVQTAATSVASFSLPAVPAVAKPTTTAATRKLVTQYLYEGGRTGVVSGGVMLGGQRPAAVIAAKSVPSPALVKTTTGQSVAKNANKTTTGWRAASATMTSWRRA
ncbi:hypothetical protein MIND_01159700 [Mycena indigotica]|uniref:Uncharacterized protein n=1 Tax=Mycena indigotica TaxID=2126181 RepID=A0A8H6S4I8_9AGAR|nr:uncharacterized protein MIND_01159700 [Mycena indigotica]KAF7292618.1 hypothetical protein MIND_01159700 [Mycena indigotica]